jgi:hypothetical protein
MRPAYLIKTHNKLPHSLIRDVDAAKIIPEQYVLHLHHFHTVKALMPRGEFGLIMYDEYDIADCMQHLETYMPRDLARVIVGYLGEKTRATHVFGYECDALSAWCMQQFARDVSKSAVTDVIESGAPLSDVPVQTCVIL